MAIKEKVSPKDKNCTAGSLSTVDIHEPTAIMQGILSEGGRAGQPASPQNKLWILETLVVEILVGHWLQLELRKKAP